MKRALQIIITVLSLLPFTFGTLGLLFGTALYHPATAATPNLDSQFRFTSGWDIGLALVIWWLVPNVERYAGLFRVVCFAVFLGGLGRLAAWYFVGAPSLAFMIVAFVEVAVPLLIPWQARVADEARMAQPPLPP